MISLYVDGELGPDEEETFVAHIRNCAICGEALEETRAVRNLFGSAEKFSAPYGFAARVMAHIEEEKTSPLRSFFRFRPFFLRSAEVAATLAVMGFGIFFGTLLTPDVTNHMKATAVRDSFHLEIFEPAPPNSVGGVYLSMLGANHEK